MKSHHYVSISERRVRGKIQYRVALKYFTGDLNRLDPTLGEEMFRTRQSADNKANDWARRFAAEIHG